MKKFLILTLVFVPFFAYSQESVSETKSNASSDAKHFMFEMNLKPFDLYEVLSFDYFQTKFWLSDQAVLRLGLRADKTNNVMTEDDYDNDEERPSTYDEKSFLFGINGGFEYRILTNSVVSPYVGMEFVYNKLSASAEYTSTYEEYNPATGEYDDTEVETKVEGGWMCNVYDYSVSCSERAYKSLGGNLIFGTDFFLVKNMYLGIEAGLGYKMYKYEQLKIDIEGQDDTTSEPSSKSTDIGFYYNSSIRFGVYF